MNHVVSASLCSDFFAPSKDICKSKSPGVRACALIQQRSVQVCPCLVYSRKFATFTQQEEQQALHPCLRLAARNRDRSYSAEQLGSELSVCGRQTAVSADSQSRHVELRQP